MLRRRWYMTQQVGIGLKLSRMCAVLASCYGTSLLKRFESALELRTYCCADEAQGV